MNEDCSVFTLSSNAWGFDWVSNQKTEEDEITLVIGVAKVLDKYFHVYSYLVT